MGASHDAQRAAVPEQAVVTRQDRDVLIAALIAGTGMVLALTGLSWVAVRVINIFTPRKDPA